MLQVVRAGAVALALWLQITAAVGAGQTQTPSATPTPDGFVPVPATITVDGVPPIPTSVADLVQPYGRFRQARMLAWRSNERRVLIATAFGTVPQIHDVRGPGSARTQLTFFTEGLQGRPAVVVNPGGKYFVFRRDISGGKEAFQLFRYDLPGGAMTMLTDGKARNYEPVLAPRSGRIAYVSTRRNGKDRDLYVMDPANPASDKMLAALEGPWSVLDWAPDESSILVLEEPSFSENYLWRVDAKTGEKTALTTRGAKPVVWTAGQFSADGQTVFAAGTYTGDIPRVWRGDGSKWTAVTPEGENVERFALSPDGKTLAVVFDDDAASRLKLLDPTGRERARPALPAGVIQDVTWNATSTEVAFSLIGARSFSDVYSVGLNGRAERWTYSETGGTDLNALPEAEIIHWKSFDGLTISGVIYGPAPRFTGPRPVIINVHGGPQDRERPRNLGRSNYFRNELGIAVIYPNIRGSSGFGQSFEALDNGPLRENAVKDIGALLDWIATQKTLDKNRVMIAGGSYGGFVTLSAAIMYGDRLRAVNPAFGITDFPTFLKSTDLARQPNRNAEYGNPDDPETAAFLTRISPLTNVKQIRIPVYLAAGAKDTRVPIAQAEQMVAALKANGAPVWYVRFENAGHQQITVPENDFSLFVWAMFVQKFLLN